MKKRSKEKEWEKMCKSEKIAYLKKLDSHPNQLKIDSKNYQFEETETTRRIFYKLNICADFKPILPYNLERIFVNNAINRAREIEKNSNTFNDYIYEAIKVELNNHVNKDELIKGQLNIIYNELFSRNSMAKDIVLPHLNDYAFKLTENNIFFSKEAKEGFEHLVNMIDVSGLKTKHFKTLWFEYGKSSNRLIIKCNGEEFMNYVYNTYLKDEKRVNFTKNSPRGNEVLKSAFQMREINFKNRLIFKKVY